MISNRGEVDSHFSVHIEIRMNSSSAMLDEVNLWRVKRIVVGAVKLELDELVSIRCVVRSYDISVEFENVGVVEADKVVWI